MEIVAFILLLVLLGAGIWWFKQAPIDGGAEQWGAWILYGVAIFVVFFVGLPLLGIHVPKLG